MANVYDVYDIMPIICSLETCYWKFDAAYKYDNCNYCQFRAKTDSNGYYLITADKVIRIETILLNAGIYVRPYIEDGIDHQLYMYLDKDGNVIGGGLNNSREEAIQELIIKVKHMLSKEAITSIRTILQLM